MWTAAFGDDEQFIDSFLIRYYSRSRMLTAEYEGRTAAMLNLLPFESQLGRTTYIYGVATAPEFRRRGLAAQLMGEAMRLIADRGDDAALLIPTPGRNGCADSTPAYGFSGAHSRNLRFAGRLRLRHGRSVEGPCDGLAPRCLCPDARNAAMQLL